MEPFLSTTTTSWPMLSSRRDEHATLLLTTFSSRSQVLALFHTYTHTNTHCEESVKYTWGSTSIQLNLPLMTIWALKIILGRNCICLPCKRNGRHEMCWKNSSANCSKEKKSRLFTPWFSSSVKHKWRILHCSGVIRAGCCCWSNSLMLLCCNC